VAAPEAANNAVCGANLIPFLSLGIPGNSAAAILGAGLMMQGIRPGPTIFQEHGAIVYAIFAGMILANFAVLWVGWYFIKMARRVLDIPKGVLFPLILILSVVGSYAIGNSIFDVYTLIGFGFMGYVMRKYKFPTAPLVIAFLLGPLAERSFRQSLIISRENYSVFFESPVALFFFCLMIFSILSIAYGQYKKMRPKNAG
jgi:putative tricarboxylic transport membrane protein